MQCTAKRAVQQQALALKCLSLHRLLAPLFSAQEISSASCDFLSRERAASHAIFLLNASQRLSVAASTGEMRGIVFLSETINRLLTFVVLQRVAVSVPDLSPLRPSTMAERQKTQPASNAMDYRKITIIRYKPGSIVAEEAPQGQVLLLLPTREKPITGSLLLTPLATHATREGASLGFILEHKNTPNAFFHSDVVEALALSQVVATALATHHT